MSSTIRLLDSVHSRLSSTITNLDAKLLSKRPSENEWSVGEVIHHLMLVEERVVHELRKGLAGPPAKASFLKGLLPMRLVSWRFIRVKAPKAVIPTGFRNAEESLKGWENCRSALRQLCIDTDSKRLRQTALPHPVFGKIDGVAAISMVAFHEQRHHKQIKEIVKKLEKRS